jgi:cobalt-zinc-cadmium efflux system outer membrane protein
VPPTSTAQYGVRVGMSFELPLLSRRGGAIAEQVAAVARTEAERAQARRHLVTARRSGFARFASASHRARFYQDELVPEAVRVRDLARTAYQLGRTPLVSLLQAEADLNHVRSTAVDASAEVWNALADLEESGVAIR